MTPYIQTITDEQLDAMIVRRRAFVKKHREAGDVEYWRSALYHYNRAVVEKKRRIQFGISI